MITKQPPTRFEFTSASTDRKLTLAIDPDCTTGRLSTDVFAVEIRDDEFPVVLLAADEVTWLCTTWREISGRDLQPTCELINTYGSELGELTPLDHLLSEAAHGEREIARRFEFRVTSDYWQLVVFADGGGALRESVWEAGHWVQINENVIDDEMFVNDDLFAKLSDCWWKATGAKLKKPAGQIEPDELRRLCEA